MSNELTAQDLLPPEIGLTLLGFDKSEQGWLVSAEGRTGSECPPCGTQSTARHSRYWRQLQDLPVQGKRVALRLRLSRWRCRNRECEQAIFRERLGEVVAPWARRTSRVEEVLLLVGHRTGGFGTKNRSGPVPAALSRPVGGVAETTSGSGGHYVRSVRALCRRRLGAAHRRRDKLPTAFICC